MNILILSQRFWPENFRINIITEKLKKNNKVYIITEKPNYPDKTIPKKYKRKFFYYENKNEKNILRVPTIARGKNNFQLLINYLNFIFWSTIAIFKFRKKKIDLLFVYATSPIFQAVSVIFFSKIYKIPSILWVQDLWPEILAETGYVKKTFFLSLVNFFIKKIYDFSDLILAQSKSFRTEIKKKLKKK